MTVPRDPTARYVQDAISTASPGRLLLMLYDRLVIDLVQAGNALDRGDRQGAHERLIHAQRIVSELLTTLDHGVGWSGSTELAALYTWVNSELIQANINGDAKQLRGCRFVIEPLRDSWRDALAQVSATGTADRLVG